jgi:hypothetical protein
MALASKKFRSRISGEVMRVRRLDQLARAATWWLLALGLLYMLMDVRLSLYLHLRYTTESVPLLSSLGLAYLLLGFYLRRTLNEPENQYLSVDLLLLFFWVQLVLTLKNKLGGTGVFPGEWFVAFINLCFGVGLILLRTQSTKMMSGAPEAKDAKLAARETIARLKELLEQRKRVRPLPSNGDTPPKTLSEATPHMD